MKNKKGALQLSFGTIIVIILAILALSFFLVILSKIMGTTSIIPGQKIMTSSSIISSEVYPLSGPLGTIFSIKASSPDKNATSMIATIDRLEIYLHDDGINGDTKSKDGIFSGTFDSSKSSFGTIEGVISAIFEDSSTSKGKFSLTITRNTCNPIGINGNSKDKVDLVVLGLEYSDVEKFNSDALKYLALDQSTNGIFSFEPFKSESAKFNVYSISKLYSLADLGCTLGCHGVPTMVCCDDKKVAKAALDCPYDQAILLLNISEFCASSSFYSKVCVSDLVQPAVLVHEFGHSFGNLGDEYSYDLVSGMDKIVDYSYPNCIKDCTKWPVGLNAGCFKTCGYPDYYRSTEDSCIMNKLTGSFCPVCSGVIERTLSKYSSTSIQNTSENKQSLPAAIQNFQSSQKEYVAELDYNSGKFALNDIYVYPSAAPDYLGERGTNHFRIISKDNQVIKEANFSVITLEFTSNIVDNQSEKPEPISTSELNYTFRVPYFSNAKSIEIYNQNNELVNTIDVSYFADTCDNNVCETYENYLSCASDCKLELDKVCTPKEDDICDPDCKNNQDPDCAVQAWIYWLVAAIVGVITIILGILVIKRLRKNN